MRHADSVFRRMGRSTCGWTRGRSLTAEQVVNHLDERELADVIYEFGEERRSRRIARAIVRSRPIRSTAHLAVVISAAARPMTSESRRIHPATRTFQALRIFVNRELDDLRALLAAPRILKPGGRVVVISFHSLRGSHQQGCLPRSGKAEVAERANQKAAQGNRRRERSQSAGTQREIAGGGKSLAPENLPGFPAQL